MISLPKQLDTTWFELEVRKDYEVQLDVYGDGHMGTIPECL